MSEAVKAPLIALAGNPNSGKTALFNALTGSRQKVANYPGVTVEKREGRITTRSGKMIRVLDLPGAYSLDPQTPDEEITRDVLLSKIEGEESPQALVVVVDATQLERSLTIVLELKQLGKPLVVALNMIDLARARGLELDLEALSSELGVPVVTTVAVRKQGLDSLMNRVEESLTATASAPAASWVSATPEEVRARFKTVDGMLSRAQKRRTGPSLWTERIDRLVVHPLWGSLLLLFTLAVMFQAVFTWAGPLQDGIDAFFSWLGEMATQVLPDGALRSLLVDGIIAGVGGVVIFLPQILLLFLFILALEDSGYMARAAFLMDRLMGKVGLHGRSFIPLLSSFACAVPGIMATRTIEDRRERLTTILISPLMTCAARLPVYTLLIAAFIPNTQVVGPFRMQGLVMLALYVIAVAAALAVAFVLRRTSLRGPAPTLLLELPTYKVPAWRNVVLGLYERGMIFLRRVGTILLSLSIVIWFLASYPKAPEGFAGTEIEYSYAGRIGHAIEPLVRPVGFDWRIAAGLVPGMAAREVMVSALATVYAVESGDDEEAAQQALGERLAGTWSIATALSLLMWFIFAPQCISTIAITRRETGGWKWPAVMVSYMFALAYVMAFATYHLAVAAGLG